MEATIKKGMNKPVDDYWIVINLWRSSGFLLQVKTQGFPF
ncbi:hypothetical protein SAMN05421663_102228 [Terribacillus halophilus]|uniref:Uncharacterized protein n=1 Tax=Terribacillus halophilus TaxID=361279 RepID=A0A1G6L2B5_9BACI|nr:hypothetical protein SAMN05421663_102228 [Terribacillus halophilus]